MTNRSREIALEILTYFDQNSTVPFKKAEIALYTLTRADRAFCWSLVMDVFRKRLGLDRLLRMCLKKPETLPIAVINALRLGVLQLFFYDSVPEYAAVNSTVDLIKERRLRGLVNGVLREVLRRISDLGGILSEAEVFYPEWLTKHWRGMQKFLCIEDLTMFYQAPMEQAYLLDDDQLQGLRDEGIPFALSDLSRAVYLMNDPGRRFRSARVDELFHVLEESLEIPVIPFSGCLSRLENRPWLLHTTCGKIARISGLKAREQLYELSETFNEVVYYTDSIVRYETLEVVEPEIYLETDEIIRVLTRKGIDFVKGEKGAWIVPGVSPKPAYVCSFMRTR